MTKVLTKSEIKKIEHLNVAQIIKHYPEYVKRALTQCDSMAQVMLSLKMKPANTRARQNIKTFAEANNISIPVWNRGASSTMNRLTKEEVLKRLVKSDKHVGSTLRKWIIKFEILPYTCATKDCPNKKPIFMGKPFNYDLDHINGDNTDNRIENLRFLCPMCHSQTETYRGRNAKAYINMALHPCQECGEQTKLPYCCRSCLTDESIANKVRSKIVIPPVGDIVNEVSKTNINYVSSKYMLDRTTLKKVCKAPENYKDGYPITSHRIVFPSEAEINELLNQGKTVSEIAEVKGFTKAQFYRKLNKKRYTFTRHQNATECDCGNKKDSILIACTKCLPEPNQNKTKTSYPPVKELLAMLEVNSFEFVARELGVSSNAIRKYLRHRGVSMPARRKPNGYAYNNCECGKQKKSESSCCAECAKSKAKKLTTNDLTHIVESIKYSGISRTATLYNTSRSVVYRFLERNGVDYESLPKPG